LNKLSIATYNSHQFENIFDQIFDDKIDDDSIKDFLLEINHHHIPTNAISGAVRALKKRMIKVPHHHDALDVCGTGGDKLNTLNISTAVAIALASAGIKIAKHGNRAVSSKSGSADIFSHLRINFSDNITNIDRYLRDFNLSFLFAPYFHPSLKRLANIRKSINEPTIFNYIGPLLNPTEPNYQMIGVSKFEMMPKLAEVLLKINPNIKAYLICGFDGMDEITISDNSYLLEINHGKILPISIIDPTNYGIEKCALSEIIGGDPEYNATKMLELFSGVTSRYLDIVALNCAFALKLVGRFEDIDPAIIFAKNIIQNSSLELLTKLSDLTS